MKRHIEALTDGTFDVCILGGGITGAGVALDAASRGLRVALIDRGDFASGTSSASSKLIHGGLRYLEHGYIPLVYEALHERSLLLRNAPHLVEPLPFVLPFYRTQRLPVWQWRAGLTLYDLLAGDDRIARNRRLTVQHCASLPGLKSPGLTGGALYYDALMDDARLTIAVLQTASRHGAVLANYVEAVGFEKSHGQITGVLAHDRVGGSRFLVQCRAALNAAGPWADAVCTLAGEGSEPHLQPTKGVHLIVPPRGHRFAFLLLHPRDGRVFFVIPWLGKTLVGTTDTFPDGGPEGMQVLPDEIDYLLDGYNHYFDPSLRHDEIMGTFAGLRPLIRSRPGEPSSLSREFRLHVGPSGLVTALGGKFTTFRQMAETTTDLICQRLGERRRCRTRKLRLVGSPETSWPRFFAEHREILRKRYPLGDDSIARLLTRYGAEVDRVLKAIEPDGFERIHPEEPELRGEERYHRAEEMAIHRADVMLRRLRIGMYRPGVI